MRAELGGTISFEVAIGFSSDWHVGAGGDAKGGIDSLVARDGNDLPYVQGSTLRGVWRDAAEQLAFALDGGALGPWSEAVSGLFGSQPAITKSSEAPLGSLVDIRDAHLPDRLVRALATPCPGARRLRDALVFVKPGVKIDLATGRAEPNFLRFEEVARRNATLESRCELDLDAFPDGHRPAAVAFLVASAGLVRRLGGKRRRGMGDCRLSLAAMAPLSLDGKKAVEAGNAEALHHAATALLRSAGTAPARKTAVGGAGDPPGYAVPRTAAANWIRVPLTITTKAPVVVPKTINGNVVSSHDHVPGTYLLRHVAQALDGHGFDPWAEIVTGNIRVLNATPSDGSGRGLPRPLAWCGPKSGGETLPGRLSRLNEAHANMIREAEGKGIAFRPVAQGQYAIGRDRLRGVALETRTHNTVDDVLQRPTEDVGGVYVYEAIPAATEFRAEVVLEPTIADKLPDGWEARVAGGVKLGRARRSGYGTAEIDVAGVPTEIPAPSVSPSRRYALWLLSDAILRSDSLRPGTTAGDLLGTLQAAVDQIVRGSGGPRLSFVQYRGHPQVSLATVRLESWQTRWGLPRPTLIGLSGGSCAIIELRDGRPSDDESIELRDGRPSDDESIELRDGQPSDDESILKELAERGIGERRGEGFGDLRLEPADNDQIGQSLVLTPIGAAANAPGDEPESSDDSYRAPDDSLAEDPFAQAVEEAAWRQAIIDAARTFAASRERVKEKLGWSVGKDGASKPGMSQLGTLRAVMGTLSTKSDAERVQNWIAKTEKNEARREKWGEALTMLKRLVEDGSGGAVWELLDESGAFSVKPLVLLSHKDAEVQKVESF